MPGLRDILDAATPGGWKVSYGQSTGEPHLSLWAGGYCIADDAFQYGRREDYELAALAPELAALVLDMRETLAGCLGYSIPMDDEIAALLARLDRLGKEPSDG